MGRVSLLRTILLNATFFSLLQPSLAHSQTTISVETTEGKTLTGIVDVRSDDDRLWLRFERPGTMLIQPLAWSEITSILHEQQSYESGDFRAIVAELESTGGRMPIQEAYREPADEALSDAAIARRGLGFSKSIQYIRASAQLANWDADIENDGLLIRLEAFNETGQRIEASGAIEAELLGLVRNDVRSVSHSQRESIRKIGWWRIPMRSANFHGAVAVIQLPFRSANPDQDLEWGTNGLLRIRLVVPGEGTFDTSIDSVRVRAWSPIRDAHFRQEG